MMQENYNTVLYRDAANNFYNGDWLISAEDNLLYRVDWKEGSAEYIGNIEEKCNGRNVKTWRGHYIAEVTEDYVICVPDRGDEVCLYRLDNKEFIYIQMPYIAERWAIGCSVILDGKMYICSILEKKIIQIDLNQRSSIVYEDFEFDDITYVCKIKDGFGLFLNNESSKILEYDIKTKSVREYNIDREMVDFTNCDYDGENYWFSGKVKQIFVWNKNIGVISEIDFDEYDIEMYDFNSAGKGFQIEKSMHKGKEELFIRTVFKNGIAYIFPLRNNCILCVDMKTFEKKRITFNNEEEDKNSLKSRAGGLEEYKYSLECLDDMMVIFSYKNKAHYFVDYNTGNIEKKIDKLKMNSVYRYMNDKKKRGIINEDSKTSLGMFINSI